MVHFGQCDGLVIYQKYITVTLDMGGGVWYMGDISDIAGMCPIIGQSEKVSEMSVLPLDGLSGL